MSKRNMSTHLQSINPGYRTLREWFERRFNEPFYLEIDSKWSLRFEENGDKAHITLFFTGRYAYEYVRGIPLQYEEFDLMLDGIEQRVDAAERVASLQKLNNRVTSYPIAVYEILYAQKVLND